MTERDAPVYCPQCGSIAYPDDNFCGVCGSAIPPDAPDATPTQTVPTQVHALPNIPTRGSNLSLLIGLGFAAVLVLGVGIGTVAALTLLRSEPENQGRAAPPPATTQQEDAAADKRAATQEVQEVREETNSKPAEGQGTGAVNPAENDAKKREREPTPEEASGSRPGYNLVQTPDGGLTVEVLQSWGVETGADSEKEGGAWSQYAGELLISSITTASSLEAWYSTGD